MLNENDVDNLFFASRLLSASHIAHGSVRVQRTLSGIGQAAGAAAYLCDKYGITPRQLYTEGHVNELQQLLIKNDATILGVKNQDPEDKARRAKAMASSEETWKLTEKNSSRFESIKKVAGAELWNFSKNWIQ